MARDFSLTSYHRPISHNFWRILSRFQRTQHSRLQDTRIDFGVNAHKRCNIIEHHIDCWTKIFDCTPILALTCHPRTDFCWKKRVPYNWITTAQYRIIAKQSNSTSPGHRQFCLYGFLRYDWWSQNQNKEIWLKGTGGTYTLCMETYTTAILQRYNITVRNTQNIGNNLMRNNIYHCKS